VLQALRQLQGLRHQAGAGVNLQRPRCSTARRCQTKMMLRHVTNGFYVDAQPKRGALMRTTVTIDDELYQQALDMADPGMDRAELFHEAIKTFVRVQAGKRLAALGGLQPDMPDIARQRELPPAS
jgi:Arc/MetJ family transcription regulator